MSYQLNPTVPTPLPVIPERTIEQRTTALQHANRVRLQRASLKRALKMRTVDVIDLFTNPPEYIHSMKVIDLLESLHKWGPAKARPILRTAEISESKTMLGMTDRQRNTLVELLKQERTIIKKGV